VEIRDLFVYDIARPITQVIKVDDPDLAEVSQELREYVVTPQIEQELLKFLEPFVATRRGGQTSVEHIGVWIAGFFGSGKSHFAKMLGYLLSNTTLPVDGQQQQAIELFLDRVDTGSPRWVDIKGQLAQLRNFFTVRALMFQIKSQEDQLSKTKESVSVILYRQYLKMLGFSNDPWIGRLELTLQQRGKLDAFKAAILAEEGLPWDEVRQDFAVVRPSIIRAMRAAMPDTYRTDEQANQAFSDIRDGLRMAPADLARELAAYTATQEAALAERSFKLVFIVDEMGQFIGDDGQRLLELQSIAEEFATQGKGRLWLIVTAQEKIEDVIAGVRQHRTDYTKISDRFRIQLRMTSENIERVLQERILKKRPTATQSLQDLYRRYGGQISDLARPENNRLINVPDESQLEKTYPFFPYHFRLMQEAFANLRAKGGSLVQLTGAERSMLGVVQGLLKSPENQFATASVGRIVRLDEIYDQIANEVSGNDRRSFSNAAELPNHGVSPVQVLKAIFLLMQVEWLPRTLDNIARFTAPRVDCVFTKHRADVQRALADLKDARFINEVDGQYRYLSIAERGIEDEIATEQIKSIAVLRTARELLRGALTGIGRVNYETGLATFEIRIIGDNEEIKSTGAISLQISSPVAVQYDDDLNVAHIRDLLSPSDERTVYWLPSDITSPVSDVERLLRLEAVIGRHKGSETSDEERTIIREKQTESDLLRGRLNTVFRRALYTGTIIYNGDETPLDGRSDNLNIIFNRELSKVVLAVYKQFKIAAVAVTEKKISEMLVTSPTNLPNVEPKLHLWDAQGRINTHAPVVEPVLEELQRRGQYAQSTDGKALAEHFNDVPYGWEPLVLRLVLAALFRAGTISVSIGQKEYSDPGEAAAQETLARASVFSKAVFNYDPTGGLTLEERKQARQQINNLFDHNVTDTTNELAQALREKLTAIQSRNEVLRARISGSNLPVPDLLFAGQSLLRAVLDLQKKHDTMVKAFLARQAELAQLLKLQEQVDQFVNAGHDKGYVRLRNMAGAISQAQESVPTLKAEATQRALDDWRALESGRSIVDRWNDAQNLGQALTTAYQQTYRDLFDERSKVYEAVRQQVQVFGAVPAEITARIVQAPSAWEATGLTYAGIAATLNDLHYDIQLAPRRQTDAIQKLQDEAERLAQQAEAERLRREREQDEQDHEPTPVISNSKSPKIIRDPRPVFIQARDFFIGEIADEAQLQTQLDAFAGKVRAELAQGKKVVIG